MADLPARRVPLPSGTLAIDRTVDLMARAAMGRYGAQSPRIRSLAIRIVRDAGVPEKDKRGEVDAIHAWVMRHLRYVNDPLWQEHITFPESLAFESKDGDCDDHAVLEAALLGALGIRSRFVTVAPVPGPMSHVYLHAGVMQSDGTGPATLTWLPLDPIVKTRPAGWEIPDPHARRVFPVNHPDGIGLASTPSLLTTLAGLAGVLRWMR